MDLAQDRVGRRPLASAMAGLILLDGQDRVMYHNPEAIKILTYSQLSKGEGTDPLHAALQSLLQARKLFNGSFFSADFTSGRRQYTCRLFPLAHSSGRAIHAARGILLERATAKLVDISSTAQQFGLTPREQETVELLTLGLTSKEIANRMNISPNTVKAFFRLVMTKMSVSTRSGIVGKVAQMQSAG
jgi:DNA-binding NarL/FixJ family response regulator